MREKAELALAGLSLTALAYLRLRKVALFPSRWVAPPLPHAFPLLMLALMLASAFALALVLVSGLRSFRIRDVKVASAGGYFLLNAGGRFLFMVLGLRPTGEEPGAIDLEELAKVTSGMGVSFSLFSLSRPSSLRILGREVRLCRRSSLLVLFTEAGDIERAKGALEGARRALSRILEGYRMRRMDERRLAWICAAALRTPLVEGRWEGLRMIPMKPGGGGGILLGEDEAGEALTIGEEDLRNHLVVVGQTGSGKTTTCMAVLESLGCSRLVIDPHGEYSIGRVLEVGRDIGIGLLSLREAGEEEIRQIAEIFADSLELSHPQYSLLIRVLRRAREMQREGREVGMKGLIQILQKIPARGPEYEVKTALLRRLSPLGTPEVERAFSGGLGAGGLLEGSHTLRLSLLRSQEAKRVFTYALLRRIYQEAKLRGISPGLRGVILIEEGDKVLPPGRGLEVIEDIFGELRKFGYGAIMTASDPSLLSVRIFGNAAVKVIHAVSSSEGVSLLSKLLRDPGLLRSLEPGEALVIRRGEGRERFVRVVPPYKGRPRVGVGG